MAISKRVSNTGATAGHGMTKIDVNNELAKKEKELREEHRGISCGCGNGCNFTISKKSFTAADAVDLDEYLEANCPFCNDWKNPEVMRKAKSLVEMSFHIEGREIVALHYPVGYRARKVIKLAAADTPDEKLSMSGENKNKSTASVAKTDKNCG